MTLNLAPFGHCMLRDGATQRQWVLQRAFAAILRPGSSRASSRVQDSCGNYILSAMQSLMGALLFLPAFAADAQDVTPDYARIVEDVGASVVHIKVGLPTPPVEGSGSGVNQDPAAQEGGSAPTRGTSRRGSGFIWTADGYVVTAGSNLEMAETVTTTLSDGREFPAQVVGLDKRTEIAVLKIDATGLHPIRFADVGKIRTGQRLLLVGAAFAGNITVADGIISHHSRSGLPPSLGGNMIPYVATTVPVQPGNGGGALFDARGEVVGMVTHVYVSRSDPFATAGFAVPGDVIRFVADSLRARGHVSRGAIRIAVEEVTKALADATGLAIPSGALVNAVQRGGPADRAGIVAGDIILQFNGQPVGSSRDIPTLVAGVRPGSRVPVQVWRKRVTVSLTVDVEESESRP